MAAVVIDLGADAGLVSVTVVAAAGAAAAGAAGGGGGGWSGNRSHRRSLRGSEEGGGGDEREEHRRGGVGRRGSEAGHGQVDVRRREEGDEEESDEGGDVRAAAVRLLCGRVSRGRSVQTARNTRPTPFYSLHELLPYLDNSLRAPPCFSRFPINAMMTTCRHFPKRGAHACGEGKGWRDASRSVVLFSSLAVPKSLLFLFPIQPKKKDIYDDRKGKKFE